MFRNPAPTLLLIALLPLTACKTWYKPGAEELSNGTKSPDQPRRPGGWMQFGADAGQLETAKAECDEADAGSETFTACMQAKGWHYIRLTVEPPGDSD
jgi:hypothetical protein